jgi:DNA gyrase/topoisomerase IV subunit A
MRIKSIKKITLDSPKPFYDITVERYSNFSIGESNIISHNSSLAGAISKLARPFGCSYGVLEGDGFFGSPVNPNPSAPRYTSVKINQKIKDIISKNSDLNIKNEEGGHDWIHVEFPVGLLTHVVGIAVGYRSNILPRKMEDVAEYLQGSTKLLKPYFRDFSGKITRWMNEESSWLIESGFEVDKNKKLIRIFDLPPVMRYDSFINKLDDRLDRSGHDYRIENRSQSKCDLIVSFRGMNPDTFEEVVASVSKLTKIIVKEDVIFVKDGNVMEFPSVKDYLDHFKVHLELVRLRRIIRDEQDFSRELAFLEAKLKFLNFMIAKKRSNNEIVDFVSQFENWIATRLQKIEIVKLSVEHIKQTEEDIKEIKKKIAQLKKDIKEQEKKYNKVVKELSKISKTKQTKIANGLFEESQINGIEIFQVEEEEEKVDEIDQEDEI